MERKFWRKDTIAENDSWKATKKKAMYDTQRRFVISEPNQKNSGVCLVWPTLNEMILSELDDFSKRSILFRNLFIQINIS